MIGTIESSLVMSVNTYRGSGNSSWGDSSGKVVVVIVAVVVVVVVAVVVCSNGDIPATWDKSYDWVDKPSRSVVWMATSLLAMSVVSTVFNVSPSNDTWASTEAISAICECVLFTSERHEWNASTISTIKYLLVLMQQGRIHEVCMLLHHTCKIFHTHTSSLTANGADRVSQSLRHGAGLCW